MSVGSVVKKVVDYVKEIPGANKQLWTKEVPTFLKFMTDQYNEAKTEKEKKKLEDATKVTEALIAAGKLNTGEIGRACDKIEGVLKKANAFKKACDSIVTVHEFYTLSAEFKNARTDQERLRISNQLDLKSMDVLNLVGNVTGAYHSAVIKACTNMGKFLVNAVNDRVALLAWTELVGNSSPKLSHPKYQDLGKSLYKQNCSVAEIIEVFDNLDKLDAVK